MSFISSIKRSYPLTIALSLAVIAPGLAYAQLGGVGAQSSSLTDPLNSQTICGLIKNLLQAVLIIGIPVSTLFLVWAGFLFVLARGNPAGLKKAQTNLKYVLLGIAVFLGAWTLGQLIAKTVASVAGGSQNLTSCN